MHKNDNDNWLLEMHYLQLGDQTTRSDLLRVFEFMPNKDVWFKFSLPLIKNLSLIITIKINFISYFLIHELHICSVKLMKGVLSISKLNYIFIFLVAGMISI